MDESEENLDDRLGVRLEDRDGKSRRDLEKKQKRKFLPLH